MDLLAPTHPNCPDNCPVCPGVHLSLTPFIFYSSFLISHSFSISTSNFLSSSISSLFSSASAPSSSSCSLDWQHWSQSQLAAKWTTNTIVEDYENFHCRIPDHPFRLFSNELHPGGPFGLYSYRPENGKLLLTLSSDHRLFLISTGFRRSNR